MIMNPLVEQIAAQKHLGSLALAFLLALIISGAIRCHAASDSSKMTDAVTLQPPSAVQMDGLIGERSGVNLKRLLAVDEEELLGGFRQRPGKQAWIGEHVGKWMHAASLTCACTGNRELRTKLDRVAAELIKTQEPDGYLGTYTPENRFCCKPNCEWDVWVHKYNLIGLLAYHQYTGNKDALNAGKRIADLLINTFGPGKKSIIATSHFNGMASTSILDPMMTLYGITGDARYLAFAEYIVTESDEPAGPRFFSGLLKGDPVYTYGDGKAYEFTSNMIGLVKLYRATGKKPYLTAAVTAWKDIAANRLYITGSGSVRERWRPDHFFPNANAEGAELCETCVTVTWMQFNAELLRTVGGAQYAEQIEKTLYNHLLGAQKPSGELWCIYPPMEGTKECRPTTNCCLSSGPRGIALLPTILYTTTADGIDVNVFSASKAAVHVAGGEVKLEQKTGYPLDGRVDITVNPVKLSRPFAIRLRVPAWSPKVSLKVNGKAIKVPATSGFVSVKRAWKAGDVISYNIDMAPRIVLGDHGNEGKMAAMYGPLVLAADASHNVSASAIPLDISPEVDDPAKFKIRRSASADGAPTFETDGLCYPPGGEVRQVTLSLSPYYAVGWGGSQFAVWMKRPIVLTPATQSNSEAK